MVVGAAARGETTNFTKPTNTPFVHFVQFVVPSLPTRRQPTQTPTPPEAVMKRLLESLLGLLLFLGLLVGETANDLSSGWVVTQVANPACLGIRSGRGIVEVIQISR